MQIPISNTVSWEMVALSAIAMIGTSIPAILGYLTGRRNEKKIDTAVKVIDATKVVADATHTLSNSQTEASYLLQLNTLQELLATDPNNKVFITRVEAAKLKLAEHKTNQAIVDDRAIQAAKL